MNEFFKEFFSGTNLVWIVGIISSIIAGLNALRKYRYEKKLDQFKETNVNLFKQEKEQVLAAISTLSVFKRDRRFESHTTNVLLSRLYTELDYDITNAICNTLIQYSNRQELLRISAEILDINRNFFVQTTPVKQMVSDLDSRWKELKNITPVKLPGEQTTTPQASSLQDPITDIERSVSNELLQQYEKRSVEWITKKRYELLWHKQITGDTYSRILRRASHLHKYEGRPAHNLLYRLRKFLRIAPSVGNELDMTFYQNDFNYVYMAAFRTSSCSIIRSALGDATIVDVKFNNISKISNSSFTRARLFNCDFKGGCVDEKSTFVQCTIDKGVFEDIRLHRVSFYKSKMDQASFRSSADLKKQGEGCMIVNGVFDEGIYTKCTFKNCSIWATTFAKADMTDVVFENVDFKDVYFIGSKFSRVVFKNCTGLKPINFYHIGSFDDNTFFPPDFEMNTVDSFPTTDAEKEIWNSSLLEEDKKYVIGLLSTN